MTRLPGHDEAGGVLVLMAIVLPVLIVFVMFSVEIGNWYAHKRHLQVQADAAAIAGGDVFQDCFAGGSDSDLYAEATKYGGGAGSTYNGQIGGANQGAVSLLYQSQTFADGYDPPYTTDTRGPCESLQLDVKATEAGLPLLFGGFLGEAMFGLSSWLTAVDVNAHARVQLSAVTQVNPSMPLAVPDVNPKQVAVTFVNEASGAELSGCSGTNLVGGTTCTFSLTKGTPVNGLNMWTGPAAVSLPSSVPANIGIRVGIGGQVGSCAGTSGTATYFCYDGSTTGSGLLMIRDYAPGATVTTSNPPVLDGVWPYSCSGSPFAYATSGTCAAGVEAEVDFGTGSTRPPSTYHVQAKLADGQGPVALSPSSYDSARHAWLWQTSGSPFALAAGALADAVTLTWEVNDPTVTISGNVCKSGGGNKCKSGSIASPTFDAPAQQQRFYGGYDDPSNSGPIRVLQLAESGGDPNGPAALVKGTHTLGVTVGLAGSYQVHAPCTGGGTGPSYRCSTDPTVLLRLTSTSGSRTYAVDCGTLPGHTGGDLYQQIQYGCANTYSLNAADVCPDPANPSPPDCAHIGNVGGGVKRGQLQQAMNGRFGCTTNNYPSVPAGDPRVVVLILTDFSAFSGSGGNQDVPVVQFGAFYVTGWDGGSACAQNEPFPGVGSSQAGDVWGHFVKYVATGSGGGGSGVCDLSSLDPCVPSLIQ